MYKLKGSEWYPQRWIDDETGDVIFIEYIWIFPPWIDSMEERAGFYVSLNGETKKFIQSEEKSFYENLKTGEKYRTFDGACRSIPFFMGDYETARKRIKRQEPPTIDGILSIFSK